MNGTVRQGSLAENDEVSYYASVYAFSLVALFATGLFKAMVFVKVRNTLRLRKHVVDFRSHSPAQRAEDDGRPEREVIGVGLATNHQVWRHFDEHALTELAVLHRSRLQR